MASYRNAIRLKPGYAAARIALARLLQRQGDLDGARDQALQVLQIQGDYPTTLELLGDVYAARHENSLAAEQYKKALSGADRSDRKRIREKLRTTERN